MDPRTEETIFEAALALPPADRAAYLVQACGADTQLRQAVESLLAAHDREPAFMAKPASDPASEPAK